jgi:hypothetical protein
MVFALAHGLSQCRWERCHARFKSVAGIQIGSSIRPPRDCAWLGYASLANLHLDWGSAENDRRQRLTR